MNELKITMDRVTDLDAAGQLETGHYFYITRRGEVTELVVSDGSSLTARYSQRTMAELSPLLHLWLGIFREVEALRNSAETQPESASPPQRIIGKIAVSNQAIMARSSKDALTLLVSSDDTPRLDADQSGVAASFDHKSIPLSLTYEVLDLWKRATIFASQ